MSGHLRRPPLAALLLLAAGLLTSMATATGDYTVELRPSVDLLLGGDVRGFLESAPVYGPSALPRIPFMLAADALGAGSVGVYLAGALACMLAAAGLAYVLEGRMRSLGRTPAARGAVIATVLLAPALTRASQMGHPEETLAGALCVLALLAALGGRPAWAGVALGAAIAAKPWALVAVPPALLAADGGRVRLLASMAAMAAAAELPFLLSRESAVTGTAGALQGAAHSFHPQQLFWPLRETLVDPVSGATGYRGPQFVERFSHPLIVALAVPLSLAFAARLRMGRLQRRDALALLALLLLLRSLLDPWNTIYYILPAILALVAWEALARPGIPIGALALTGLTYLSFVIAPRHVGADGLAAAYLLWALPATVLAARAAFGGVQAAPAQRAPQPAISATAARTAAGAI